MINDKYKSYVSRNNKTDLYNLLIYSRHVPVSREDNLCRKIFEESKAKLRETSIREMRFNIMKIFMSQQILRQINSDVNIISAHQKAVDGKNSLASSSNCINNRISHPSLIHAHASLLIFHPLITILSLILSLLIV